MAPASVIRAWRIRSREWWSLTYPGKTRLFSSVGVVVLEGRSRSHDASADSGLQGRLEAFITRRAWIELAQSTNGYGAGAPTLSEQSPQCGHHGFCRVVGISLSLYLQSWDIRAQYCSSGGHEVRYPQDGSSEVDCAAQ